MRHFIDIHRISLALVLLAFSLLQAGCRPDESRLLENSLRGALRHIARDFNGADTIYFSITTDWNILHLEEFVEKAKSRSFSSLEEYSYVEECDGNESTTMAIPFSHQGSFHIKPLIFFADADSPVVAREGCVWISRSDIFEVNDEMVILFGIYETMLHLDRNGEVVYQMWDPQGIFPHYFLLGIFSRKDGTFEMIKL